ARHGSDATARSTGGQADTGTRGLRGPGCSGGAAGVGYCTEHSRGSRPCHLPRAGESRSLMTGILWVARRGGPWLVGRGVRPVGKLVGPAVILRLARPFVAVISAVELVYAGPTFAAFDRLPEAIRPHRGLAGRFGLWRERTHLNLAKLVSSWS